MTGRRWRDEDPERFAATVAVVAEELGVQALAVEKDYWVCEALRAIETDHPGQVVFKGGTSLEKLRIIKRFSEDLDLLVVGSYESKRATERALKEMLASAARATMGEVSGGRSGGNAGTFHRSGYLAPPLKNESRGGIADPEAVLVELGQSGGPNPSTTEPVVSLLARELTRSDGFDVQAWADLAPFETQFLHPGRTLVEKLLRVHKFAMDPESPDVVHGWDRIGRQFYDIHSLLLDERVRTLLADRNQVNDIIASAIQVSQAFPKPDLDPPTGGFAASPAFDAEWSFSPRIREAHDRAMADLYYGLDEPPTFDDVLATIRSNADLLDSGRTTPTDGAQPDMSLVEDQERQTQPRDAIGRYDFSRGEGQGID